MSDDDGKIMLVFLKKFLFLDDFGVPLPPGFVPDKSVMIEEDQDSDYDDYDGEGVPTVKLIPSSHEALTHHGSKPVRYLYFCAIYILNFEGVSL